MGFKFRTPDCTWGPFRDVASCVVLDRPNKGLLYTVLSLTQSLSHSQSLSLRFFYVPSARIRVMVFPIEALQSHWETAFGKTTLHEWSVRRLTTQNSQRERYPWPFGIRTYNRSNPAAAAPCLKIAQPLASAPYSKFPNIQLTVPALHALLFFSEDWSRTLLQT